MGSLTELMEPEMHPLLRAHLFKALTTGEESVFECQMRHADGASRRMRSSAKVVERHKDGSSSVVACVVDITDIHLAEQRLRLLEKLAVLGEVSSGIAHELNQPLAAIAMAAENGDRALLRDPPNLQTARDKFIRINEQAHRISAVIDHVRAFSRGDTKKAEPLDIGTVLHEALILLEARISANGIELDIDVPRDLPPVHAVSVLLEQAVMNVIGNACDAYRDNPLHTRRVVRIAARADGARLRLTIADQAGGIPEALLSRIFDPFFTTKPVGKGTGLGLSISLASIVEMGGRMTVRNQHGGACFEIVLPVEEAAQPALETVGSPA
jgi:C4-dicarboxylate-specific signal transduction histidine kinase